ncbi:Cof-type HAD-IIB family hydrolase [Corynebacterium glutamicum]|uniref:Cof-type HAD-IIB family hydrolase n=1 Tax=Corynebacterium glutamicum TaxID=1718 RepID=UPI000720CDEF|nr:Cof-type HAD-IIB family hydrolase [Corynebacterium glutamicum]ALP51025.1 HAD family hydrolase [Corynebacterium glutamicum]ANU34552.1 HAD family hydrolase [Corynebacterium glutamicum]APT08304.1 HAD family hydrolase [Corynebacterium glutamicum]QWQ85191.1 HAD family hydrolase [Corynebacterium glutamicum]WFP72154.1 Cof-type HAD-IIB family hydrolase [Corynebacterium glutamicum]
MGKLLFVDIGGTLLDYSNEVPRSAVDAIRKARAKGHRVYLSSGRSSAEVTSQLWDIGVDGLIGANGGYVESAQESVFHRRLSGEETRHIVEWLYNRGLEFYLESNNGLYASRGFREASKPVLSRLSEKTDVTVDGMYPDMFWGASLDRDDVNKISYIFNSQEDLDAAREAFPNLEHTTWGGQTGALFGTIGVSVNKKIGVDRLLKYLNADRANTIAFGDSDEDLSLFEASAYGVAMGEATESLKAAADLVTDAVGQDGLRNAFLKLELIDA